MDPFAKMIEDALDSSTEMLEDQLVAMAQQVLVEQRMGHEDHADEALALVEGLVNNLEPLVAKKVIMHLLRDYTGALHDLMAVQPAVFRIKQYTDELDRVDEGNALKYGPDVHTINMVALQRSDLASVQRLLIPDLTAEDIERYEAPADAS